jgi:DeoR/GlpR family transcriptional regulator of sugar metabolism
MIAAERQQKILDMVIEAGKISISEICELFQVSEMTARRDLRKLDQQGLLRRVHGGAITSLGRSYEPPFSSRSIKNLPQKKQIGKKAAELIFDGDSIALDVGTTTIEVIYGLKDRRDLTIVTSCLQIANAAVENLSIESNIRLIVSGGIVRPRELSMVGAIPEQVYKDLHVDKAFLGIGGVSLQDGFTEFNLEDTRVKQNLIRSALEVIVLADSSKIGQTTFGSVCTFEDVNKFVTDSGAPTEFVNALEDRGVEVLIADGGI